MGILLSSGSLLRAGAPLIHIVAAAPVFCAGLGLFWFSDRLLHWDGCAARTSFFAAMARRSRHPGRCGPRVALPALTVGAAGAASVHAFAPGHEPGRRRTLPARPARHGSRPVRDRPGLSLSAIVAGLLQISAIASSLLAATAVAEWVFGWHGAADLFLKSVALQDWTVVALVLLVFAALTMTAEFLGVMERASSR